MAGGITRRDFLDGMALAIGVGLTPAKLLASPERYYPPALMGLRGQHPGSFEIAHRRAWMGEEFDPGDGPAAERYDLIVVGGGISGLAAAWFYRERHGAGARILILENLDDFGGHAKRNEFRAGSRLILGYGGSESLQSPQAYFSPTVGGLMRALGVDLARFETAFERDLYPGLGLARGVFFDRESFGQDRLVVGDGQPIAADDIAPERLNARPIEAFIADFPLSEEAKAQLVRLHTAPIDWLDGMSPEEKEEYLRHTSYHDYVTQKCGLNAEAAMYFQARPHDFFALGTDALPAWDGREVGYPGFAGLGLAAEEDPHAAAMAEPYIHHFPDGNASIARLLVRSLVPEVAGGKDMEDIVLADFDYSRLDRDGAPVRIRLNSMAVHVRRPEGPVEVVYVDTRSEQVRKVEARHCVLACFNMIIPHLLPELPAAQKEALASCVKAPLVYTKVVARDWRPFAALGVHEIYAPMAFHARTKLDYPVSLGGYRHPRSPDEPIGLQLVHVPLAPHQGLTAREQYRAGRARLLEMSFADFEEPTRDQLDRMLGAGGFASGRDITAITVNRWSHGYAYATNSLDDPDYEEGAEPFVQARRPFGNVTIANSDAAWDAYAHAAIDEAARAVAELPAG
jgi:spermidine dehydrogenase